MTPIDPNAVIDAIARHFPDGFDEPDKSDCWPSILIEALDLDPDVDERGYNPLCRAIDALKKEGRLRYLKSGYDLLALSHTEQARRCVDAMDSSEFMIPEFRAGRIELLANVLAGKTEKKA